MKKLLNKLREKPKLYKCLKILGIVGACLSLIFNAVIIGSAIAYNSYGSDNDKNVSNVATTPIKGLVNINDTAYIEGAMNLALLSAWQDYSVILFGEENNFATGYTSNVPIGTNATLTYNVPSDDNIGYIADITYFLNNGWTGWSDSNVIPISSIAFYVERNNTYFNLYQITINLNRPTTPSQYNTRTYFFREYYNGSLQVGSFNNGLEISLGDNGNINLYAEGFVYSRYSSFYNSYGAGDVSYNSGYEAGVRVGYNNGYSVGYQDGLDNNPTNVFDMLASAFNSIASVLNIELLPNLPLGMLIFTPVIVTIIIVVVKMIKG